MDNVFENFVSNVYTGGSSMEFFDNDFQVVGGVDDISVSSIFGGCSCSDMEGFQEEYEAEQKLAEQSEPKGKQTATGSAPEQKDDKEEVEDEYDESSLVTTYGPSDEEITTEYTPTNKKKAPKVGSGSLAGGLSANDVSELLSVYH